jgi:hypothetical protein
MKERILYDIFIFFLILHAPFWLYLPALVIGIIIFPLYWEAVPFAAFIDFFYGPHTHMGSVFAYPFGLSAAVLVAIFAPIKERLRFLR